MSSLLGQRSAARLLGFRSLLARPEIHQQAVLLGRWVTSSSGGLGVTGFGRSAVGLQLGGIQPSNRVALQRLVANSRRLPQRHARLFASAVASQDNQQQQQQQNHQGQDGGETPAADQWQGDEGVSRWLFACAGLVFAMVCLGGMTRLTRAGLSMTNWRLAGESLPMTVEEWEAEFARYKQFPEYQKLNQDMTLEEFKFIFMMEWSHRMLGRLIGIAFGLPLIYFAARGRLTRALAGKLALMFGLGGGQGLIGWWMVRSGLDKDKQYKDDRPTVSPYRLAVHLIAAFGLYSMLYTTAIQAKFPAGARTPALTSLAVRGVGGGLLALILITATMGAFVAANDAGKVYNEFPTMGGPGRYIPSDLIDPNLQPVWRNLFENDSAVQFVHRWLGVATLESAVAAWLLLRGHAWLTARNSLQAAADTAGKAARSVAAAGSTHLNKALASLGRSTLPVAVITAGLAGVQTLLGLSALRSEVDITVAATHQAGSLMLLTSALMLHQATRYPSIKLHEDFFRPAHRLVGGAFLAWALYQMFKWRKQLRSMHAPLEDAGDDEFGEENTGQVNMGLSPAEAVAQMEAVTNQASQADK